jgi:hypothetical protein
MLPLSAADAEAAIHRLGSGHNDLDILFRHVVCARIGMNRR